MTLNEFYNGLRLLRSIDLYELQAQELWRNASSYAHDEDRAHWIKFRDNPYEFLMRCDDETADKIWAAMKKRMKP